MQFFELESQLKKIIKDAVCEVSGVCIDENKITLEHPKDLSFGDYATTIALILAKDLKKSPMEIAEAIASQLKKNNDVAKYIETEGISALAPGFINFTLSIEFLRDFLNSWEDHQKVIQKYGNKEKVLVEYVGVNVAKELHVGHLRSTIIGDSVARTLEYLGYEVITDDHMGDWGTQFGILLRAYNDLSVDQRKEITTDPLPKLNALYIEANELAKRDTQYREECKAVFTALEKGDSTYRKYWEWFVEVTTKECDALLERLRVRKFDYHFPESYYALHGINDQVLKLAQEHNVLCVAENGAQFIDLESQKLDQAFLTKGDESSTYLLRDVATLLNRQTSLETKKIVYFVDGRQSHHFKQVFAVAKLIGLDMSEVVHAGFGMMKLPDGAMSTRKGNVIKLSDLIDEAVAKAKVLIQEKGVSLDTIDEAAHVIGVGAVKYADLSQNRTSDFVFDWNKVLNFQGNTSVYIQYTYARIRSLIQKANTTIPKSISWSLLNAEEIAIAKKLWLYGEVLATSTIEYTPHHIAQYLFELSNLVNTYYHNNHINDMSDQGYKQARLMLLTHVASTLKIGLSLLGIETVEQM